MNCLRCGKENPASVHTCTPLALRLAEQLDRLVIMDEVGSNNPLAKDSAAELRRLHAENEALRQWIREQSEQTDTCTYNILREKCAYCRCHRSKK